MNTQKKQQLSLWRWHFYSGLYVAPFMLMLALTGIVMMYNPHIEDWRYADLIFVEAPQPGHNLPQRLPASVQLQAVKDAYPGFRVRQYQPPKAADRSSRFKIRSKHVNTQIIFVNPYNAEVLGRVDSKSTWYAWADDIHGTLLLGEIGDALIELSAGLTFILLISGFYLYWPRGGKAISQLFIFRLKRNKHGKLSRNSWLSIHACLGVWLSLLLFLFALTGMAWTGIWGQKLVQPFSSFPIDKRASNWQSDLTHADLNSEAGNEVAWNLAQVPLPRSSLPAHNVTGQHPQTVGLDTVITQGQKLGFDYFRIALPTTPSGVYSLMSITSSGDIIDPRLDRTVHIDQYSGVVLADIGWKDYNIAARAMAAGIPLHKGQVSLLNLIINTLVCLLLVLSSAAALVLWVKRRNKKRTSLKGKLSAPPLSGDTALPTGARILFAITALLFPVTGVVMIIFWLWNNWRNRNANIPLSAEEDDSLSDPRTNVNEFT